VYRPTCLLVGELCLLLYTDLNPTLRKDNVQTSVCWIFQREKKVIHIVHIVREAEEKTYIGSIVAFGFILRINLPLMCLFVHAVGIGHSLQHA
jgi:hypothetical protein